MADLLDVRDLKIGATAYPPGEPPKDITIVHGVSFTLEKGRVLGLIGESGRSEEHTSELQSLMRISYAVFCLKKKTTYSNTSCIYIDSTQVETIVTHSTPVYIH